MTGKLTAHLGVQVAPDVRRRLDAVARARGISRSAAVRQLLETALLDGGPVPRALLERRLVEAEGAAKRAVRRQDFGIASRAMQDGEILRLALDGPGA